MTAAGHPDSHETGHIQPEADRPRRVAGGGADRYRWEQALEPLATGLPVRS